MEPQDLTEMMRKHPFLNDMNRDLIETLTSCASNVLLPAGAYVFKEGEEAKIFYLIRSGRITLKIPAGEKGSIGIQTVSAGEVLGWSWLISPYRWHFDAFAIEEVHAFALDATCLRKKCNIDHDFGYEMLRRFIEVLEKRLEATRFQLLDIYR